MDSDDSSQNPHVDPFAGLYSRTFRRLWAALGRMGVTSRTDKEDFAQDTYVVANQKLATRNPAAPELAWVLTIARNIVRSHRALMRTKNEMPTEPDIAAELSVDGETPEEIVGRRMEYLALVEHLLEERREVFELHDVEGFTAAEIATTLGIPEGTVTTRLRLARQDILAAATRLKARDGHRAGAAFLLPFGVGAGGWHQVREAFDDAPEGAEEAVWRGIRRALARVAALLAAGATSVAVVGKATAAALLGAGFVAGALLVGVALVAFQTAPGRSPPVVVAEATLPATLAAPAASHSTPEAARVEPSASAPHAQGTWPARAMQTSTAASSTTAAPAPTSQIDPDEMALIARAQVAFTRKDRPAVLEALDAHRARFPKGLMASDREAIRSSLKTAPWATAAANNPGPADAGRSRLFGSDE